MNPKMNHESENDPSPKSESIQSGIGGNTQNTKEQNSGYDAPMDSASRPSESNVKLESEPRSETSEASAGESSILSESDSTESEPVVSENQNISKKSNRDTLTESSQNKERSLKSNAPKKTRLNGVFGAIVLLLIMGGVWWGWNTWQKKDRLALPYPQFRLLLKNGVVRITPTVSESDSARPLDKKEKSAATDDFWLALPKNIRVTPDEITGDVWRSEKAFPTQEKNDAAIDFEKTQNVTLDSGLERVSFRVSRYGLTDDPELLTLLERYPDTTADDPPGIGAEWMKSLLFILPIVLILYLFFRKFASGALAMGQNTSRMYEPEELETSFADVAGVDEAVEEVREIVDFLKTPEKFRALGGRIPRGVLLVGPPGTGKTLLARAIAGEAGVPFFSLSGSDFVEMFVGVGAARVRDLFNQAKDRSPCIIFIDELDALGKTRGNGGPGGHDEREQTLNALLVEMDGFSTDVDVIVIAATNRPETLDAALLRPGRFDRHILVDRPDLEGRKAILRVHATKVKLDESVDLDRVAAITPGFAGADLANLINEATLLAARRGLTTVTMSELDAAVERITAGLEKRQRVMSEEEKRRVAFHEAGHALVACCLPSADPVHKVSIIPRGFGALGWTMQRPEHDRFLMTRSEIEVNIQTLLGGTIAEELIFGEPSTGAQNDLERATELVRSMVVEYGMSRLGRLAFHGQTGSAFLGEAATAERESRLSEATAARIDAEMARMMDENLVATTHLLEQKRDALERIAAVLLERETLLQDELLRLISPTEATSPRS